MELVEYDVYWNQWPGKDIYLGKTEPIELEHGKFAFERKPLVAHENINMYGKVRKEKRGR